MMNANIQCRRIGWTKETSVNDPSQNDWIIYDVNLPAIWYANGLSGDFANEVVVRWNVMQKYLNGGRK